MNIVNCHDNNAHTAGWLPILKTPSLQQSNRKTLAVLLAPLMLASCWQEKVFDNSDHPSRWVMSSALSNDGDSQLRGSDFERLRELHPEEWQDINIRGMGYIFGLRNSNMLML